MRSSSLQVLRRLGVLGARSNGLVRAGCALFQLGSCSSDAQRSCTSLGTPRKCHLSTLGPSFGIWLRASKLTRAVASRDVKLSVKLVSSQVIGYAAGPVLRSHNHQPFPWIQFWLAISTVIGIAGCG